MVADVDPESPGCEYWSSEPDGIMYSCKGEELAGKHAPVAKVERHHSIWLFGGVARLTGKCLITWLSIVIQKVVCSTVFISVSRLLAEPKTIHAFMAIFGRLA